MSEEQKQERPKRKAKEPKALGYGDQHQLIGLVHRFFSANAKGDAPQMKRIQAEITAMLTEASGG